MRKSLMFKGTLLVLGLFVLLAQLLVGGGCKRIAVTSQTVQPKPTVIAASFYPMYIMTKNIAVGIPGVQVINMTRPTTGCLHDYQVTTDDLKNLEGASFFVINGAGMESFLDKVTAQMPNLKLVDASKGIALIKNEGGDDNPHIWVSVSLAMQQVTNIPASLTDVLTGLIIFFVAAERIVPQVIQWYKRRTSRASTSISEEGPKPA